MNQPATLDTNCEWENIVNYAERHNARCQFEESQVKTKLHKMMNKALVYAIAAAMMILMEWAGVLTSWVAVVAAIVLSCMACYAAGKFVGSREARYGR